MHQASCQYLVTNRCDLVLLQQLIKFSQSAVLLLQPPPAWAMSHVSQVVTVTGADGDRRGGRSACAVIWPAIAIWMLWGHCLASHLMNNCRWLVPAFIREWRRSHSWEFRNEKSQESRAPGKQEPGIGNSSPDCLVAREWVELSLVSQLSVTRQSHEPDELKMKLSHS